MKIYAQASLLPKYIIPAPKITKANPMMSNLFIISFSTNIIHKNEDSMYMPPYIA